MPSATRHGSFLIVLDCRKFVCSLLLAWTSSVAPFIAKAAPAPTTVTNGLAVYLNFDNNLSGQAGTTNNGSIYTGGALHGPRYKAGMIGPAATFANTSIAGQPSD